MKSLRILLIVCLPLFLGVASCDKYAPPKVEQCSIIVMVDEQGVDSATCYCADITLESFDDFEGLVDRIQSRMQDHPKAKHVLGRVIDNMDRILEEKTYELPIFYCRGYVSTSAQEFSRLENWAEDNRIERIKCEKDVQKKKRKKWKFWKK